ncbi:MAG: cupin domain-containing protein [Bacteroidia bacterium]
MKNIFLAMLIIVTSAVFAQQQNVNQVTAPPNQETNFNQKLFSDSLAASFVIIIKKEVKLHLHALHTEHVYVISGEAVMKLGDKNLSIKAGDVIFIPKGTPHSVKVTSAVPLKIISVQSPNFEGKDRIALE